MKRLLLITLCFCSSLAANAELTLKEIRTASKDVLVAFFTSTVINADEVNTAELASWKLNGQPVTAINKFVTEADACDHHIYLQVPALVNGTTYTLQTPHGERIFVFEERSTFCESIKSNQSGYSALSKVRYANFAIWLGDGGTRQISGDLPTYTVFKLANGAIIAQGTLQSLGTDASSGDFVYRIDLAAVPEGGPYKLAVKGCGCSYPFGVGADFSRRLGYVVPGRKLPVLAGGLTLLLDIHMLYDIYISIRHIRPATRQLGAHRPTRPQFLLCAAPGGPTPPRHWPPACAPATRVRSGAG
jgi:endoglucanase